MRSSIEDMPVTMEVPQGTIRQVAWGGMNVGYAEVRQPIDVAPLLKGLPDDRCQSPHWGYVIKGQVRYQFPDREEVYNAGDVFYAEPGHSAIMDPGCHYLEFSPSDEADKTAEVVARNIQAMQGG